MEKREVQAKLVKQAETVVTGSLADLVVQGAPAATVARELEAAAAPEGTQSRSATSGPSRP